jgi:ATP-binding protein involved in chromosome partitioning
MAQPSNPFDQQKAIPGIKNIFVVASGKGGVGKSTVSSNLALALAKEGQAIGLLDADIYGPSLPRMFGALNQKPQVNDKQQILPLLRYGIKIMSMGFLVEEGSAVVWRGPMLFKAIDQFFRDVDWGTLDALVIDLPPGTGDVQLSIAQKVPVTGAVVVTTPQNVALADVKKSIDMFRRVNIPILGMVENMASFKNPVTGELMPMFPKGELDAYLDKEKITKLCQLPFYQGLAQGAEIGIPFVESKPNDEVSMTFQSVAKSLISKFS